MTGILSVPATIWEFQIVRFRDLMNRNYLGIPDSSSKMENAGIPRNSAEIANGAISDHIADTSKMIVLNMRAGI